MYFLEQEKWRKIKMNKKLLNSFIKYCEKHPEERFWQALRNWSGAKFICISDIPPFEPERDTFYFKGKRK